MSFWSHVTWEEKLKQDNFPVSVKDSSKIDQAGYRLSIGPEVYLSRGDGSKITHLEKDQDFYISPGQFAYILTEEHLDLPLDTLGFISPRAKIKFYGLLNVSGFHVDPGYRGRLIFAVFNSGPTRITLRRGQDIFCLWLTSIDHPISETKRPKPGYDQIPADLINKIDGQHLTAYQLSDKIDENKLRVENLEQAISKLKLGLYGVATVVTFALGPMVKNQVMDWLNSQDETEVIQEEAQEDLS